MMASDPSSIESIQSRAPALSKADFEFIDERMGLGELFPGVTDPSERETIKKGILSAEVPIPTLWTLVCDVRYLKKPARVLNALLPPLPRKEKKVKNSLYKRFRASFSMVESGSNDFEVQQSTISFKFASEDFSDGFEAAYQQLWLCACRVWKYPNAHSLTQLATLADRLGFSTTEITRELAKDPGRIIIEKALQEAHHVLYPGVKFGFNYDQARPLIGLFNEQTNNTLASYQMTTYPFITVSGPGEPLSRRCGHSFMDTEDLGDLFLDKIHAPLQCYHRSGDGISSFYVKRSRHVAFFGALVVEDAPQNGSAHVPLVHPPQQHTSVSLSSYARSSLYSDEVSLNQTQDEATSTRRTATFIENDVEYQVPYEMESINKQAQIYAKQGKKLRLKNGHHMVWYDCFQILERAEESTVIVYKVQDPTELNQTMAHI